VAALNARVSGHKDDAGTLIIVEFSRHRGAVPPDEVRRRRAKQIVKWALKREGSLPCVIWYSPLLFRRV
jgi:hypothetical protein